MARLLRIYLLLYFKNKSSRTFYFYFFFKFYVITLFSFHFFLIINPPMRHLNNNLNTSLAYLLMGDHGLTSILHGATVLVITPSIFRSKPVEFPLISVREKPFPCLHHLYEIFQKTLQTGICNEDVYHLGRRLPNRILFIIKKIPQKSLTRFQLNLISVFNFFYLIFI